MWKKIIFCISSLGGVSFVAQAQTAPDIEAFAIPADALTQNFNSRDPYVISTRYFLRNPDGSKGDLVAIEYFHDDIRLKGDEKLIKRELYKVDSKKKLVPNRLNGVQREWYLNGQLKSEEPYRMHREDGLFRYWDEQGHLTSQYQMADGNGIVRMYNANGQLEKEEVHKDNYANGPRYSFYPRTTRVLSQMSHDEFVGPLFFFTGSKLLKILFRDLKGRPHGPQIMYDLRSPKQKENPDLGGGFAYAGGENKWVIYDLEASEEDYAKFAATDKTLPPYYKDLERYKEYVTPEVTALLKKYIEMPRVKIPLEFDAKGEPIPASPDTPWIVEPNLFQGKTELAPNLK